MKVTPFFLSLVFFQLVVVSPIRACICSSEMDIMQYSAYFLPLRPMVIAKAKIIGVKNNYGTQLQIIRSYVGTPTGDTVVAWGSFGDDCREMQLTRFYSVGDTVIAILFPNIPAYPPYELKSDYYISRCGATHLRVKGDSVIGGTRTSHFTFYGFPLDKFEDSLNHLVHTLSIEAAANLPLNVKVYPNPTSDKLTIEGMNNGGKVVVLSIIGQQVMSSSMTSTRHVLHLSGLPAGIYLLVLTNSDGVSGTVRITKN